MPGLNGRDLFGRLQQRQPGLKVLFVSGYLADLAGAGMDILPKPFTPDMLLSRVRLPLGG